MAIFGWKKGSSGNDGAGDNGKNGSGDAKGGAGGGGLEFSPQKAESWFRHARVAHDSQNFEYAMTCWLSGLQFDPANMPGIEGFFASAGEFRKSEKPISKDLQAVVNGRTPVHRYLVAMLNWSMDPMKADLAVKAAIAPAELNLAGPAGWIAPKALDVVAREAKPRKDWYKKLVEVLTKVEKYDLAVRAGEAALRLDPSDNQLAADIRNLAAQSTMSKGGYDKTGEAGGFRSNVKDLDKQRKIEEEERMTRSEATSDRVVIASKETYDLNPLDRASIKRYVKALLDRGTPDDEATALSVLDTAFEKLQEYQFRQLAGDIRVRQGKRTLRVLKEAMDKAPGDAAAGSEFREAEQKQLVLEIGEFEARVAAYPTDLTMKYELGARYFMAGKYNESIGLFQQAKADNKSKSMVLRYLALAFQKIDWQDEAIETFRQALEGHTDTADEMGLELRYGLLCSLQQRAAEQKDLANADEAYKLASNIAIQRIDFRDIRMRRDQIKALVAQLKSGA